MGLGDAYASARDDLATRYPWLLRWDYGGRDPDAVQAAHESWLARYDQLCAEFDTFPVTEVAIVRDADTGDVTFTAGSAGFRVVLPPEPPDPDMLTSLANLIAQAFARVGVRVDPEQVERILHTIV